MSYMLDIVGSFIIGGLLLLAVMSSYSNVSEFALTSSMNLSVQENLREWTQIVQHDLRKVGYHLPDSVSAFRHCDTTSIIFLGDIDNNGTVDSVSYFISGTEMVPGTENPRDRMLTRSLSGQQITGSLGITDFQLAYYDSVGSPTWVPSNVKAVEVFIQVESAFPLDTTYVRSNWRGVISPINLR
jgi:hypothetical protein